jgi:ABC-type nitrate/sulfonate/bicarbonate transport system ATPase subunit
MKTPTTSAPVSRFDFAAAGAIQPEPIETPVYGALDYSYTVQETLLSVENVSQTYDAPVLRDVHFEIKNIVRPGHSQGQINALLAPSGMGKSTLFRAMSGLIKPTTGTVFIHDEDGTKRPVKAGDVGVVAQDFPLFNHLTVIDNILMAAKVRTKNAAERKTLAEGYLTSFGLADRAEVYPHQLSGGQRQRVSIIQQVVSCGHMLLMDEPFSGLDVLRKEEVQHLITRIAAAHERNSIVITTHDISAALAIADTVDVLGRERDVNGAIIPGARVLYRYNLMDMGITWRPENHLLPQFSELEREIKARFHEIV